MLYIYLYPREFDLLALLCFEFMNWCPSVSTCWSKNLCVLPKPGNSSTHTIPQNQALQVKTSFTRSKLNCRNYNLSSSFHKQYSVVIIFKLTHQLSTGDLFSHIWVVDSNKSWLVIVLLFWVIHSKNQSLRSISGYCYAFCVTYGLCYCTDSLWGFVIMFSHDSSF